MTDHPQEGGSYVRQKDGSLKRVEATAPAEASAGTPPAPPETQQQAPPVAGAASKAKMKETRNA